MESNVMCDFDDPNDDRDEDTNKEKDDDEQRDGNSGDDLEKDIEDQLG
jgi:hypothetical protein